MNIEKAWIKVLQRLLEHILQPDWVQKVYFRCRIQTDRNRSNKDVIVAPKIVIPKFFK